MIPKICANCSHSANVMAEMFICAYLPVKLVKNGGDTCGCFDMSSAPNYVLPDNFDMDTNETVNEDEAEDE